MKKMQMIISSWVILVMGVGCPAMGEDPVEQPIAKAVAILSPTEGNQVHGRVYFISVPGGVQVIGDIEGLTPGRHGFHIHEKGDCNSPDGSSAGAHFNPLEMPHAGPRDASRHMGDLGNIAADEGGHAHIEYIDSHIHLSGEHSVIGRGVIVHAQVDDFRTQPTGNAGARVACGVIEPESGLERRP